MRAAYYLIIDLFPLDIRQTYLYNITVDVPKKANLTLTGISWMGMKYTTSLDIVNFFGEIWDCI